MINVDASVKICKNILWVKKNYIKNPASCNCENGKYLGSNTGESVITYDGTIEKAQTIPKYSSRKSKLPKGILNILFAFLLITSMY